MAGEFMVINPSRRRRRRVRKNRRSRRRVRHLRSSNPPRRRRRRHYVINRRRRHGRRHHRINAGGILGSVQRHAMTGIGIVAGIAGTRVGTALAVKFIPGLPAQLTTGVGRLALKGVIGFGVLPFVLKLAKQPGLVRNVQIGAAVDILLDLYVTNIEPSLVKAGLGDYGGPLGVYQTTPELSAYTEGGAPEEIGAAENMYADTMYGY